MKKQLLSLVALCLLGVGSASAQSDILVGDMNDDGQLTVGDVTTLVETVAGRAPQRTISTKCDPNASDPAVIAGSWRAVSGTTLSLTADGAATYSLEATVKGFEYYPFRGDVVLLNADGYAVKCLHVARLAADYLVFSVSDGTCSAYYPSDRFASGFVLSATSLSLRTGEQQQLSVLATPDGSIAPSFKWTSSDTSVATVTADGLVTAVKGGTCTITATAQDGTKVSVSCTVSVVQLVESITLSESAVTLELDGITRLTATVLPADANDASYTWSSSNDDVAEVTKNGVVYAVGYGTATITATANDGSGVKAECVVTVKKPAPQPLNFNVNGVSFNMLPVEHGTFQMGQSADDNNVTPVHSVTISQDYYIGETEVTQALWKAVTGYSPTSDGGSWSSRYGLGDNYPAYHISWNDCQDFITKLNAATGQTFRMPTDAEWEYAAKGGNNSQGYTYSGSNTIDDVAWYTGNSSSQTHPVAMKAPNELGLYDMSGNVWEWCSDLYSSYSSSAVTDPTGATSGSDRVLRGGSWNFSATSCRSAYRTYYDPTHRLNSVGFRLCLSPSK